MAIRFLRLVSVLAVATALQAPGALAQSANQDPLSTASILHDPDIPVLGNPKGDVTIVEYFDYRCPYCKKVSPVLQKLISEDRGLRLVFKDFPVFGDVSIYAARLVFAAKYQNKYTEAHEALISAQEKLTEANVQSMLTQAGVDVPRAQQDLETHRKEIDAVLARNHEQAMALGFQGTPGFIIGKFRVPGAMDEKNFKLAIAESRAAAKKK